MLAGRMADTVQIAAAADAAGYDAAWTGEFNDRSAIVALSAMAHNTSRCRIGSAIAYGVGRSPLILANDARGLDELSGGRLVLGLGTGTKGMQIGWHGVKDPESPALRLEELVPLLRRIWKLHEGPVKHEGRFVRDEPHPDRGGRTPDCVSSHPDLHRGRGPPNDRDCRPCVRRSAGTRRSARGDVHEAPPRDRRGRRREPDGTRLRSRSSGWCLVGQRRRAGCSSRGRRADRLLRRAEGRADVRGERLRRRGAAHPQGFRRRRPRGDARRWSATTCSRRSASPAPPTRSAPASPRDPDRPPRPYSPSFKTHASSARVHQTPRSRPRRGASRGPEMRSTPTVNVAPRVAMSSPRRSTCRSTSPGPSEPRS